MLLPTYIKDSLKNMSSSPNLPIVKLYILWENWLCVVSGKIDCVLSLNKNTGFFISIWLFPYFSIHINFEDLTPNENY